MSSLDSQYLQPLFDDGDELVHRDEESYRISSFIARGGTGEVYRLASDLHGSNRIVKLFLPFYYLNKVKAMGFGTDSPELSAHVFKHFESLQVSSHEYSTLAELNHPYVVRVHDLVRVILPKKALDRLATQFGLREPHHAIFGIIASYVDGERILDFAASAEPDKIFDALYGIAQALDYLNLERNVLHLDVKNQNVLIQPRDALPVLVDFGLAQDIADERDRMVSVATDVLPVDPGTPVGRRVRAKILSAELVSRSELREAFFPWLDRFQFGRLAGEVAAVASRLPSAERLFLERLAGRLQDVPWLLANKTMPLAPLVARTNLNRLYPIVRTGARLEDLRIPAPTRQVNVPSVLRQLAQHPALVRLNRQNQLSLLPARFPGATHTRYLHSLDTYRLTRLLARRLLDRPAFRSVMGESDVLRLLVAALYHDVNHLPLLHIFQELSDKSWLPDPFSLAVEYRSWSGDSLAAALGAVGMDLVQLAVLTGNGSQLFTDPEFEAAPQTILARSILDGGADLDKLSYLQLDSVFSGLHFAADVDVETLFDAADISLVASARNGEAEPVISFSEEAAPAVEALVRARTAGFERLYWCDENRAMMACVLNLIRSIAAKEDGREALYGLVRDAVGASDFGFLEKLEALGNAAEIATIDVTSFFDGSWDQIVAAMRTDDEGLVAFIRQLNAAQRADFDAALAGLVAQRFGAGAAPRIVLVDVPNRTLGIGKPLWIRRANGSVDDAESLPAFTRYADRLRKLSTTMTVFTDRQLHAAMERSGGADREVRRAIDELRTQDTWH